jgi:GNAT superfamily N-acetyltransferase
MGPTEARPPIVALGAEEAEAVMPLSMEAGWNQLAADWRFMLSAGQGAGVRDEGGRWIGTGLVLPLGERIAWISMVLVNAAHRRQGLGGALLEHCFERAEQQGSIAGLDATELGRPVYLRYGFRDVYPLRRWRLDGLPEARSHPAALSIVPLGPPDLDEVARYDRPRSGLGRRHILAHLLQRQPRLAFAARRGDTLAGYVLARDGRLATQIGPVVADGAETAAALVAAAMHAGAPPYMLDVPDAHPQLTGWLERQGATAPRGFMRMLRGSYPQIESEQHVFALAGPELA